MPTVCIIGAGYAGVHAARTAHHAGADVVIVEPTGQHDLAPRLAGVAAGRRPAGDAWAPLEHLVDAAVRRDRVTLVEPHGARGDDGLDTPVVHLEHGEPLLPDAVVVTVGAGPQLPDVPGLDPGTAWTLKTAPDALRLRAALAEADRLVVVGGGATGVQLAAEVAHAHPRTTVTLVETTARLLGSFDPALGQRARRVLEQRGVEVQLGTATTRARDGAVELDHERWLEGLVVWTTGVAADGHALLPQAATSQGRLVVDRCLRVTDRVLAAGDVAAQRDLLGRVTAPSAQIALQAGRAAGRNAALIAHGRSPRRVPLLDLGWVVDLGGRGIAQLGPFDLTLPGLDLLVPALHEAIDLRHLWQAGGANAVLEHAAGRHQPSTAQLRRAERPALRSVG